jgi:hypothetical protein
VKATNHVECPPKERHLRREWILILVEMRVHHVRLLSSCFSLMFRFLASACRDSLRHLRKSPASRCRLLDMHVGQKIVQDQELDCASSLLLNCSFIKSAIAGGFLDFFLFQLNINSYLANWCILVSGRTENADSDTQATPRR